MNTENDFWNCLYDPISSTNLIRYDPEKNDKCIKYFFDSLKYTFSKEWNNENKTEWMNIIKIFSILDTHHLKNLIKIYENNFLNRSVEINKYLKNIKKYNEFSCSYFIVALQHFLIKDPKEVVY